MRPARRTVGTSKCRLPPRADRSYGRRMHAVLARRPGGPEVLEVAELPVPVPGPGQVRLRVAAAAVNPIDLSARSGRLTDGGLMRLDHDIPLGWDVAGRVDAVGDGVTRFGLGDDVVGLRDLLVAGGTHADQVVLDEGAVAPAPRRVDPVAAATLPLNALTADRSLALAGVGAGGTVLVTGAAGGVGGLVLQLAAMRAVRTVASVRPRDVDTARRLGATHVVTDTTDLAREVRGIVPGGVDAVIDAAVLGIEAHGALRSGGTFVALVRPFAPPPIRATTVLVQEVAADGARLTELAALVDFGVLDLPVAEIVPFHDAGRAHELVEAGGRRGRIVLVPNG
jgi:NADPH:quinone reductase